MPFRCPACSTRSLLILSALEVKPDSRWDEITLQTLGCTQCGFTGVAVYQESRRGALDAEIVHHDGYSVDLADRQRLERAIRHCPTPSDTRCTCFAHRAFGGHDAAGRWKGLSTLQRGAAFTLER